MLRISQVSRLPRSTHTQRRSLRLAASVAVLALAGVILPATGALAVGLSIAAIPGASNTGVPVGTVLTKYYGDLTITKAGTIIDGLDIRGLVRVEAANVTIRNTIIRGRSITSNSGLIYAGSSKVSNLVVQDTELFPTTASAYINGIYGSHFTLLRVNIHGVIDSVHIFGDTVRVVSSWLHDNLHYVSDPTWNGKPSHDDSIQIQKGNDLSFTGNTISGAYNAAFMVTQGQGVTQKVLLVSNVFSGGVCTVNVTNAGTAGAISNLTLRSNVFGTSKANCNIIIDKTARTNTTLTTNTRADGKTVNVVLR